MNQEEAKKLATPFLSKAKESILVTSDHSVYIDSDFATIEAHAKENKLELFVIMGEEKKEPISEELEVEKPIKKKK